VAVVWVFYCWAIAPLLEREWTTQHRIAELSGQVESTGRAIWEIREMEQPTAAVRAELDRWRQERSAASAMLWFSERMKQHFTRAGLAEAVTRLNTARAEPELPRFQRMYWAVEVPLQAQPGEFNRLLLAVADLAQTEPHARVMDLTILRQGNDAGPRTAVLNVSTLAGE
jgi:hypothetical protein